MKFRQGVAAAALIGVSLVGGAVGATLIGTASAATSPTPSTGSSGTTGTAPSATGFHSNEDPTHEAGESAAREAAENNGTATYGPPAAGSTGTTPAQ